MKRLLTAIGISCILSACTSNDTTVQPIPNNQQLADFFEKYYHSRMELFPLEATANGEKGYNHKLFAEFTDEFVAKQKQFFSKHLAKLETFDRKSLNEHDKTSYDIFKHEMATSLEGLNHPFATYIPFHQFWGVPLTMGQLGSGEGNQPFRTLQDYADWYSRAERFHQWADSAIVYFRKGMAAGVVLPEKLVLKMIPQMEAMLVGDAKKTVFWGAVTHMPDTFSKEDKASLARMIQAMFQTELRPAYEKLAKFLKNEYLPKAGKHSGIGELPGGKEYYNYLARYWTTTNKTPDEIYQTGLEEVKRIRGLMDSVKNSVGFTGSLDSFFTYIRTDKKFKPYTTAEQILDAYRNIQAKIDPNLKKMFGKTPKTPFEIRQTEAFRAASASAEYNPGLPDGSRPGIFYIPIVDPKEFNVTSGMENLFLHEAIPGHHYQIALQTEDTTLPKFRRFLWYGAYGEGWALYTESLGKELGLYTDPYQYMGALGDEIHRAIRLVVDVGLHTKNMTREEAIRYMMSNEAISEEGATAEIERYMAIPGQALSYKIGQLKIQELRNKYAKQLGDKFQLAAFHDEFLSYGCVPLDVLEKRMDAWAERVAK